MIHSAFLAALLLLPAAMTMPVPAAPRGRGTETSLSSAQLSNRGEEDRQLPEELVDIAAVSPRSDAGDAKQADGLTVKARTVVDVVRSVYRLMQRRGQPDLSQGSTSSSHKSWSRRHVTTGSCNDAEGQTIACPVAPRASTLAARRVGGSFGAGAGIGGGIGSGLAASVNGASIAGIIPVGSNPEDPSQRQANSDNLPDPTVRKTEFTSKLDQLREAAAQSPYIQESHY